MIKILRKVKSLWSFFEVDFGNIFEDITEEDLIMDRRELSFTSYHNHPSQYELEIKTFPEVTENMDEEALLWLLLELQGMSKVTRQNLFSYIFINCNYETYVRFSSMFFEDELEEISPKC